jgi:hypothetical protein
MATEQVIAFLLFVVVVVVVVVAAAAAAAVTPGPSNVMLTAAGAKAGVLKGLKCLFGVTTGMGLMMFLVPFGLGSLVLENPPLPLAGVQNGQTNNLLSLVANDDIIIGEFTVSRMTRFFKIHIQHICLSVIRRP